MKPRLKRWACATIAVFAISGCRDLPLTEPSEAGPAGKATLDLISTGGDVVAMLDRSRSVERTTVTKLIGPAGGHIQIGGAGVRVEFAPGAVAVPTPITVTALAGRDVAYDFQPHGLVFHAPVIVRQSLRHTTAWKNPLLAAQLQGSYFDRLFVDATRTYARSLERRPARLRDDGRLIEFTIEHFSGYMLSTGKMIPSVEVDIEIDTH
jgi:hypothetical protein